MASTEKWAAAAADVLGAPVSEIVPLARRKPGGGAFVAAGVAVFGVVVFLHELGVIPGPTLLVFMAGAVPMSLLFQLALEPVFGALTPAGIEMTSSTRLVPKPVGPPLGPLDPAVVTGPHSLLRNAFDIQGTRHRVAIWQRARFQRMLAAASVGESPA